MKNSLQTEVIADLKRRKKLAREYLRSLTPAEKIARFVDLQERYYQTLVIREKNGGRSIPERWQKWHKARYEKANVSEFILD